VIHTNFLIVGAGPTGLGAAWRLHELGRRDWLLCEGSDVAGGLAGSTLDEHGFTWDYGGHVQFSHYGYFDELMTDLLGPDGWHYHDRESWVWVRGRFVPYPFQLNIHRLPAEDAAHALEGIRQAVSRAKEAHPTNFGEWIDRTFGPGIAALFMRPYNTKVWARDPERMAWDWIGDRVAVVDLARVTENMRLGRDDVSWGPNNQFRFPKRGGTGVIWRTLAERIRAAHGERLRFNQRLVALDTKHRHARFAAGDIVEYERLLSTMALDDLVRLSDLRLEIEGALGELESTATHVVGVGLQGQTPAHLAGKCWMYFPEPDCPFYRVTHFSHYAPANVADPGRQWSLMAEVSESVFRPLARPDVENHVVDGLIATGLIAGRDRVHHTWHRRLPRGYPVPSLNRDRALERLLPAFESRHVRSRGRFGAWKYEVSNQDHSFAQGVEAIDSWLSGVEEETLHHPDRVNARRPAAPRVGGRA
jgi:protoporphyrinogen oxidase